jgi:antitoxin component YwqK of YwqJK toxin-antitoxin module
MKNFKFNGKRYGKYISYYENGNIYKKCNYKNRTLHGESSVIFVCLNSKRNH